MAFHIKRGALAAALLASTAMAAQAEPVFNRVSAFQVSDNIPEGTDNATPSSAEIIAATEDGMMLIYSDSPLGGIGMVDISDPAAPKAAGFLAMEGGEPTSVSIVGGTALVGVNTTDDLTAPSGFLAMVDIASKTVTAQCDLGGQPDSVAISPDKSLVAIAIENQRDEDLNDGVIPQMPAGDVKIFALADGVADCASMKTVDLTGIAAIAPEDPEPEFVDFNDANDLVVTLQENNHIAIIDGATGAVTAHFSAGTVDLDGIDTKEDGALVFADAKQGVAREPDAIQWLDGERFVMANEGDYEGGSRGFTIMSKTGEVLYESGPAFEYEVARAGHYPEGRSDAKGVEPEGLEVAAFGDETLIFVLSERGSAVGVYRDTGAEPEFLQLLPSGISPEGAVAIPGRNLLATANEVDLIEDGGVRAHVMLYERAEGAALYPTLVSQMDGEGRPIGWGALSGLAADPDRAGTLHAVSDSVYAMQPTIFAIDATQTPAVITGALRVTRNGAPAQKLDIEGIALDGEGGYWLASEGDSAKLTPHALYHVDADGEIQAEIGFPAELLAGETRFGAEGVTLIDGTLWIAIQRGWGDDPENTAKLVSYNIESEEWGAVRYPLETAEEGWVGLSEISRHGDYVYIVERDNQIGSAAKLKKLYRVALGDLQPAALGGDLPLVTKEEVRDFLPDLAAQKGYIVDKLEGFTVDASGEGYAVTDNDGVDDSSGETLLFSIGKMDAM